MARRKRSLHRTSSATRRIVSKRLSEGDNAGPIVNKSLSGLLLPMATQTAAQRPPKGPTRLSLACRQPKHASAAPAGKGSSGKESAISRWQTKPFLRGLLRGPPSFPLPAASQNTPLPLQRARAPAVRAHHLTMADPTAFQRRPKGSAKGPLVSRRPKHAPAAPGGKNPRTKVLPFGRGAEGLH